MKKITCRATVFMLWCMFMFLPWAVIADDTYYAVEIHAATQSIMAIAWDDFDEHHSGNELACLMADGSVMGLYHDASGWTSDILFEQSVPLSNPLFPEIRPTISIGDVVAAHAGNEIVINAGQKLIAIYRENASTWTNAMIKDSSALMGLDWGATVGDCDTSHAGDEIFYIYEAVFDFSNGHLFSESNGLWNENIVFHEEVGMGAVIGDTNPDHAGNEIVVVTEMGPAYEILPPAGGGSGEWPKRKIWDDYDNAGWVVKIGDVEPANSGNELVYGTRYASNIMLSRYNGTNQHSVEMLFTNDATTNSAHGQILDIAIGNLVENSETREIVGVDYNGSVYLIQKNNTTWNGSTIWRDPTEGLWISSVAVSDIFSTFPGDEIIVAGESGAITLFHKSASAQAWWDTYDVLDSSATTNDYAAVNIGQFKNIASKSYQAIVDIVYNGDESAAPSDLQDLKTILDQVGSNDYALVNIGQVKALASKCYSTLEKNPPWDGVDAKDYSAANIGQVKNAFSFEIP